MNGVEQNSTEKFEELIKQGDVRNFLKASPLESGERSTFDKVLTEEYYYLNLYAHSKKAENLITLIQKKMANDDTHNFILSGYKGSGKSTFIRYFLKKINIRNIMINFDDNWEPNIGIKKNIVMALNNQIYNDLFPKNSGEACTIIKRYLEIFHFDGKNKGKLTGIDMNHYFSYFGDKLEFASRCISENKKEDIHKYYENDIVKHTISGTINEMLMLFIFWDIAEKFTKGLEARCCIVFENLDVIYNTPDIPDMIKNVVAFRNNIDKICQQLQYQGKSIGNPSQDYLLMFVMRETTKAEFASSIDHFSDRKIRFESISDISEIYDLHDIVDRRYRYLDNLMTEKPEYKDIPNYVALHNAVGLIETMLKEPYLHNNLFSMLNNDYRTSVELLGSFDFNHQDFIEVCNRMIDLDKKNWSKFGFRSIFFREVFNIFVREGYFAKIQKFVYTTYKEDKPFSINLDRLILLYLSNSYDAMSKMPQEKEFVSLDILYNEIKKICKDKDFIVDALWQMYDLRKEDKWNHLVTFDNVQSITHEELKKEMQALEDKRTDYQYAKVKITKSGEVFLDYMLPHFEYYAARYNGGKEKSLFAMTAEEVCEGGFLERTMKGELKEVKKCCKCLYGFFRNVLDITDEFKRNNFLNTKFASKKISEKYNNVSRMFHCERIIYSNIGYLDRLRFYVFDLLDTVVEKGGFDRDIDVKKMVCLLPRVDSQAYEDWPREILAEKMCECILKKRETIGRQQICIKLQGGKIIDIELPLENVVLVLKACLNVRLVDGIISFIDMFGLHKKEQFTAYSNGTPKLCELFMACIDKRIKSEGFLDFTSHIDVMTGEIIIAEDMRKKKQEKHRKGNKKTRMDK